MEFAKIWAITVVAAVAAVAYGIAHDNVTARVCVEYFTVGHPPMFETESPTLLAFGWGTIATWWVGAIAGVLIGASARLGSGPPLTVRDLLRPAAILLAAVAFAALTFGIAGYIAARLDLVSVPATLASDIPSRSHDRFVADWWAHLAAYATAALGVVVLCGWILLRRFGRSHAARLGATAPTPPSGTGARSRA